LFEKFNLFRFSHHLAQLFRFFNYFLLCIHYASTFSSLSTSTNSPIREKFLVSVTFTFTILPLTSSLGAVQFTSLLLSVYPASISSRFLLVPSHSTFTLAPWYLLRASRV